MGEHTKGPWLQHEDYPRVVVAAAEPTTSLLALDMTDGNEEDPIAIIASDADARLIAAAPELLEALESLLDEQNGPPLLSRRAEWHAAVTAARAAIKKARGEE